MTGEKYLNKIGSVAGFIREATVKMVDLSRGTMRVVINRAKTDTAIHEQEVPIPSAWAGPGGEFSGGHPVIGSTIWIALGAGGTWSALPYAPSAGVYGRRMSALQPGRWLTQVKNDIRILADPLVGIQAGSPNDYLHVDPQTQVSSRSIISYRFDQALGFTEAARHIEGPARRDLSSNFTRNISGSALESHIYDDSLTTIGLDPLTRTGGSFNRNPPFTESRNVIYEFSNSYGFTNDEQELARYDAENPAQPIPAKFPRRESRADAFSLSLSSPNYLVETIIGTGIDVYGNILDLNREKLPSGNVEELSFRSNPENQSQTFTKLREQNRKAIAIHFELNAQKTKVPDKNSLLPPTDGAADYARDRSRFSLDIDKEGQFKLNIPASSEIGNIGLLTRHENYSTLKAAEEDSDPNEFVRNVDNKDIFLESFGVGVISLTGEDQVLEGFAAPTDRVKNTPIKLGTAYHDLTKTVEIHDRGFDDDALLPVPFDEDNKLNNRTVVPFVGDIVNKNIIVSGPNANAGGRSGTFNSDGFLSLNIGANTVDRQSLWIDMAGGYIMNVGRDRFGHSAVSRFDGDVLVQIGGTTVANDSRFDTENNALKDGVLDIRLVNNAQMTIIRIDASGVRIATPGEVDIESAGNMRFKSKSDIILDGKGIYMYSDGTVPRWIRRSPGQTI